MNEERDVLLIVIEGSGTVRIDGVERPIEAGRGIVVEKGRRFGILASEAGLRYVSIHVRRPLRCRSRRLRNGHMSPSSREASRSHRIDPCARGAVRVDLGQEEGFRGFVG